MKFSLALIAISAAVVSANPFAPAKSSSSAKAAYMSKLMRNARPTENSQLGRRLEEDEAEEYEVDISGYSMKFEQCQFVKAYDDELAGEDSETILATRRFVIFRLCPTGYCDSCSYNFGEYIVDLEEYLEATVDYQKEMQEEMCNACQECQNWDDEDEEDEDGERRRRRLQNYNIDCDNCYDECMKIENMEENGYIDATEFLECQMVYDAEDDGKAALYAGPMCASNGSKIKIGLFTDEECNVPDSDKDVDDYLMDGDGVSMKLSHALLKTVYSSECISCLKPEEEDENQNDDEEQDEEEEEEEEQEPEVLEMCEQLYDAAAKCEKTNGFDDGYANYDGYENQLAQEGVVCDFVESLKAGSYDETGEIVVNGANSSIGGGAETTGGQKFALTFFILGTAGLAGYAAMLHSKLTKSASGLAESGGSMA
eukprot:CAMPEP_0197184732 /NCGR_PEP_ID=MMETSP1423-20130617/10449_1 /TAXON_ID=476441 /ORGANISM="Pseudo-nitzschia heimii, Strain UNC1101" /LENGTH=426 /DNA_ID=CAMNT_0042635621 /DNA_START=61 /DNA_END=1341 /DNA_ORIENTATION=-